MVPNRSRRLLTQRWDKLWHFIHFMVVNTEPYRSIFLYHKNYGATPCAVDFSISQFSLNTLSFMYMCMYRHARAVSKWSSMRLVRPDRGENTSAKYCCNAAMSVWEGHHNGGRRNLAPPVPTRLTRETVLGSLRTFRRLRSYICVSPPLSDCTTS